MEVSSPHLPDRRLVLTALGVAQILAWGTSFYFPAVFADPIRAETGWPLGAIVGGTSIGLLVAGLISPQVGAFIGRHGGRAVLLASSLFYAAGLFAIGVSTTLPVYWIGWVVLGIGMGTGLYDAVFATLGRMYGAEARSPITNLTLFGGFASTICWPLSAFLIQHFGWRDACFIYAAIHLFVSLPLQMAVIRRAPARASAHGETHAEATGIARIENERTIFSLLALVLSIAAGVGSIVVVHLLIFLQAKGIRFDTAVVLGTIFGPSQVGARLIVSLLGNRYHAIWTLIAACTFMATGLLLLNGVSGLAMLVVVILLYGGGYGISWIARGTVPLALFGPVRFPPLMGKLAFPSLIVQALAPSAGALLIEATSVDATIGVLTAFALINVVLIGALWWICRPRPDV